MRTLVFVLAVLALAAVLGALGGLAVARDTVPSRTDARAYIVERFPRSAPRALLPDRQAWSFHTSSLWVQRARRCRRNERLVQVECTFTARLAPNRGVVGFGEIRCRGEVWVRLRDGQLIGRPGDYVCVA